VNPCAPAPPAAAATNVARATAEQTTFIVERGSPSFFPCLRRHCQLKLQPKG
jgi:hypothetical protein